MKIAKTLLALVVGAAFPAAAAAGPGADPSKKTQAALGADDLAILQHHHDVNLMEIEMGKLAQTKGSAGVKKYAAALIKDHQKADKDAMALAKARGATLQDHATPADPVAAEDHKKQMATMQRLQTLEGADFEREYLAAMVDGHTAEVGYLTVAVGKVSDAKLKAHLTKVKAVVERHAQQAKALQKPTASDASPPAASR